eukprot:g2773.t1
MPPKKMGGECHGLDTDGRAASFKARKILRIQDIPWMPLRSPKKDLPSLKGWKKIKHHFADDRRPHGSRRACIRAELRRGARAAFFFYLIANLPDPNVLQVVSYTTVTDSGSVALKNAVLSWFPTADSKKKFPKGLQVHLISAPAFKRINPDRFCCKSAEKDCAKAPDLVGKFVPPVGLDAAGGGTDIVIAADHTAGANVRRNPGRDVVSWDLTTLQSSAPVDYGQLMLRSKDRRSEDTEEGDGMVLGGNSAPSSVQKKISSSTTSEQEDSTSSAGRTRENGSRSTAADRKSRFPLKKGLYFIAVSNCGRRSATHLEFQLGELDIVTYDNAGTKSGTPTSTSRSLRLLNDVEGAGEGDVDMQRDDELEDAERLLAGQGGQWISPHFHYSRGYYLPALDMPKLIFYGFLAVAYLHLMFCWCIRTYYQLGGTTVISRATGASLSALEEMNAGGQTQLTRRDPDNILIVHHLITIGLVNAFEEACAWYLAYAHWNFVGYRWHSMVFLASFSTATKQGCCLVMLLLAAMGVGITKPMVSKAKFSTMLLLGSIYVLTDTYRKTAATMENRGGRTAVNYGGSQVLGMLPASLITGCFFLWITSAFSQTLSFLQAHGQTAKEKVVYRDLFQCALLPLLCAVGLILYYEITFVRNKDLAENWESRWYYSDLATHGGHFLLVLAICWHWRPHSESRYLSYAMQLRANERSVVDADGGVEMSYEIGGPQPDVIGEEFEVELEGSSEEDATAPSEFQRDVIGNSAQPGAVPRISEHALCTESTDGLYFCKFSPSDDFLAASDARGEIHVLQNKRTPATSSTSSSSNKSVFEPLPYTLKCGTGRGGLQTTSSTPISVAFTWRPESEQVSQKSVLTVVRTDGYIQQFHAATGRSLHEFNAYEGDAAAAGSDLPALYCVDYAPDAGGKDPEIFVYDEMSKKQLLRLQRSDKNGGGHSSRVCAAKFSNPNLLVTGGWDCTLQFWDLRKGSRSVANLYGPSILGAAGMDIFGSYVVAGSDREGRNPVQCYDMRKLVGSHFSPSGAEKEPEAAPVGTASRWHRLDDVTAFLRRVHLHPTPAVASHQLTKPASL